MSREYRVVVSVGARESTVDERSDISVIASDLHFHETLPEEWDNGLEDGLVLSFEGTMTLGGGQSEREAHAGIRAKFLGRAVQTQWWYLEGAPNEDFSSEATDPVEAAGEPE